MEKKEKLMDYFPHYKDTTDNLKIKKFLKECGAFGYGVYWGVVERLYYKKPNRKEIVEILSLNGFGDESKIDNTIDIGIKIGLFVETNGLINCDRVNENIEVYDNYIDSCRKGGKNRWKGDKI